MLLESPDYFFRVREIGRLRQTSMGKAWVPGALAFFFFFF